MLQGYLTEWDQYVPMSQFFVNSKISEHHQSSPFAVMFARAPNSFEDHTQTSEGQQSPSELQARINFITEVVYPSIRNNASNTQSKMAKKFDSSHQLPSFTVGSNQQAGPIYY
jgi:hypothetical protein